MRPVDTLARRRRKRQTSERQNRAAVAELRSARSAKARRAASIRSALARVHSASARTGSSGRGRDQAYRDWIHKPAAILAYGSTGGARAGEHLRAIAIELQMVPVRSGVHIMGADLMKVHPMGESGPISAIEDHIMPSAKAMLDDHDWWTRATMAARSEVRRAAA
jgi:hypothetical protein